LFRYDISNDGQIDQKELATVIAAMVSDIRQVQQVSISFLGSQYDLVGQTDRKGDRDPNKCAAEIIAALDVGGDKKLNRQEFIAG
jgi:Ca2+-binding EF-hand superfamily protein